MYSTSSWNAFKLHCSRKHPHLLIGTCQSDSLLYNDEAVSEYTDEDEIHSNVYGNEQCYIGSSDIPHKNPSLLNLPNIS